MRSWVQVPGGPSMDRVAEPVLAACSTCPSATALAASRTDQLTCVKRPPSTSVRVEVGVPSPSMDADIALNRFIVLRGAWQKEKGLPFLAEKCQLIYQDKLRTTIGRTEQRAASDCLVQTREQGAFEWWGRGARYQRERSRRGQVRNEEWFAFNVLMKT